MSYRLVIDFGTHQNYIPFESEWAAKMKCRNFRSEAKWKGLDSVTFTVEAGDYIKNVWVTKEVIL